MGISGKIKKFFSEIVSEAKKVNWPTKQQAFNYTLLVIGLSLAVAAFLGLMDFIFLKILERFIL